MRGGHRLSLLSSFYLLLVGQRQITSAFDTRRTSQYQLSSSALNHHHHHHLLRVQSSSRRRTLLVSTGAAMITILSQHPHLASAATTALLTDKSNPDIPPFTGNVIAAKDRVRRAIHDIDELLTNYDTITSSGSGGDTIRLYLGTQGVKSNMYGITKVLTSLRDEAIDIVEYTEALNEFGAYLGQADGAAYQSLFAEFSSAKIVPGSLLKTAQGDIVNMRKYMTELAIQLKLDET